MIMKELVVYKSIFIKADNLRVWEAITNPDLTKLYMYNSEVISGWKEGNSIIWRDADNKKVHVKGIIFKIEPGRYLATKDLSIDSDVEDIESNYSRVVYKLINKNGGTNLTVTEDNFNNDVKRYNDSNKFWNAVLMGLKELLEENI